MEIESLKDHEIIRDLKFTFRSDNIMQLLMEFVSETRKIRKLYNIPLSTTTDVYININEASEEMIYMCVEFSAQIKQMCNTHLIFVRN